MRQRSEKLFDAVILKLVYSSKISIYMYVQSYSCVYVFCINKMKIMVM